MVDDQVARIPPASPKMQVVQTVLGQITVDHGKAKYVCSLAILKLFYLVDPREVLLYPPSSQSKEVCSRKPRL